VQLTLALAFVVFTPSVILARSLAEPSANETCKQSSAG